MSAFVLDQPHLRALTNYAFAHGVEDILSFCDHAGPGESHRDAFGRLLLEENLRSVCACYPDTAVEGLAGPGPLTFDAGPQGVALHDPLTILQACECFDYQACETRD